MKYEDRWMGGQHHILYVSDGGKLIGWVDYSLAMVDEININHIEVIHKYRGRGYGRKIVNYLLSMYPFMRGAWRDQEAKAFWLKVGADFERGRAFRMKR